MKTLSIVLLLSAAIGNFPIGSASAAGNPCAAGKPEIDAKTITRPQGYKPMAGDAKLGEKLWHDTKLSTNGLSCNSCHQDHGAFQSSFAKPYPHQVAMARDKAGMKRVHLDEMIQACMVMPMAAKPLPWDSRELAALKAYTLGVQKTFKPGAKAPANPCSAKPANPCAAKPANPCAKK
ncbi:MAG: cytochrome c peroxidase [Sulfuricella sp.]|nr:cytochrome c peroxidase [Sulfuricella sp.]